MAHALRIAAQHVGFVSDPNLFDTPIETLLDPAYHKHLATLVARSRPKTDLRRHVEISRGVAKMRAGGASRSPLLDQQSGSCELAIVDADGNWVQMINTLQTGGIPGMVIGGVPMVGSHATAGVFNSGLDSVFAPQARMRSIVGNTMVLRAGRPVFSLGTPGLPQFTVPQVLANLLSRNMSYEDAVRAPRMWALGDDNTLAVESRLPPNTADALTSLGIALTPSLPYDWHFGSFQMAWRETDGGVGALSDLRRCGIAAGIE
jgi:gamma-glutamyltranspeptidase/glutathione hydrolase